MAGNSLNIGIHTNTIFFPIAKLKRYICLPVCDVFSESVVSGNYDQTYKKMELNIWTKRYFDDNSKIEWPCPSCNTSSLDLNKDKLNHEETASSKKFRSENEDWEIEWIQLVFNGQLTCKNCGEVVFFTGTGNPEHNGYYDQVSDEYYEEYTNSFTPTFFQPFIKLFNIPDKCSEELKVEIENSFKLFLV